MKQDTKLRTLLQAVESVGAPIIITNTLGEIEYVNPKFSEVTGYSLAESLGLNPRFLKDPDRPSADYQELWETITQGRTWQGTFRNVKKNGSYYWESATISPVFDTEGEIIRFVAVKEDITERRQAEQRLRESEEKFRQLVQRIPVPLCYAEKSGSISYVNERFIDSFGYTLADIPTLNEWWLLAYPQEGYRQCAAKAWEKAVEQAALDGQDIVPQEHTVTCKNGLERTVMIAGVILGDQVLSTFTDITEQRRDERLLKVSYERKNKNDVLNELIQDKRPSNSTLTASARMLGMRILEPFSCYLVAMNSYRGQPREYWLERRDEYRYLADSAVDELSDESCIAWESINGIGVLCFGDFSLPDGKEQQNRQAEKIRQTLALHLPELDVSVGISECAASLAEIGARYRQTFDALHIGRNMWPQRRIYHYLDLGIFQILPYGNDPNQLNAYIDRIMGKLLRYDKQKKAEYLETLELILQSNNLKETAGKLSIHYKTLMFRKQRIEEILGISFDDLSSRMAVATALQLMKIRTGQKQ